jgi:hypothetical protein
MLRLIVSLSPNSKFNTLENHNSELSSDIFILTTEWEDISIVLNEADPTFGQYQGWEFGATGGEMTTADQGRTWNFTTLEVPETAIQVTA